MATLPVTPPAFSQKDTSEYPSISATNVAPFGWSTNDVTSVRDIITYVQTALQAAESAQAYAAAAEATRDAMEQLDAHYQSKLVDIDSKYDQMVTLAATINVSDAEIQQYMVTTKGYMDQTQIWYDSVQGLRNDVITYAMQAIYKYADNMETSSGTYNLRIADGTVQYFKLMVPQTQFIFDAFTDPTATCRQLTIMLEQGTGANKVTWPSNIKWNNNRNPVLSYVIGKIDFFTVLTKDSGATWYGFYNGGWFDA